MAIPDSATAKKTLRRQVSDRLPPSIAPSASAAIVNRIRSILTPLQLDGPVSLFAPRSDEADLLDLLRQHPAGCWLFPRVEGREIVLHPVKDPASLKPGCLQIREPPADSPSVPAQAVRVFLCPGAAFDPAGRRLGRGRGYYDRLLARRSPDSLVIGICCEQQIVAEVPCEAHDVPMDLVITERRILGQP